MKKELKLVLTLLVIRNWSKSLKVESWTENSLIQLNIVITINNLGGHYKICVESSDNDLFVQNKKIRFSLVIDTDLDEPEGTNELFYHFRS